VTIVYVFMFVNVAAERSRTVMTRRAVIARTGVPGPIVETIPLRGLTEWQSLQPTP
jgi:hypothetical protein